MSPRCLNSVQGRCAVAEVLTVAECDWTAWPNCREWSDQSLLLLAAATARCDAMMNILMTDAYADSILQRVGGLL